MSIKFSKPWPTNQLTNQPDENICNDMLQQFSKKLEEVYKRENNQLKEETHFLRKLLEKNLE